MKKLILSALLGFIIFSGSALAQCTPDTSIKEPGYYPDVFPPVVVGVKYSQVLQIRVIKDTAVLYNNIPVTAKIDSINLIEIMGLPEPFSYTCYNPTCSYIPTETGCATLTGTARDQDVGTHPLELVVKVYAKVFTVELEQDDTIRDQFALVVTKTGQASIVKPNAPAQFYPNPSVSGQFHQLDEAWIESRAQVFNTKGQLVLSTELENGMLDISNLPAGIYTYVLTNKSEFRSVGRLVSTRD